MTEYFYLFGGLVQFTYAREVYDVVHLRRSPNNMEEW